MDLNIGNALNVDLRVEHEDSDTDEEELEAINELLEDPDSDEEEDAPVNVLLRERRLLLRQTFNPLNPMHCPPTYFRRHYRMSQESATRLLDLVRDDFDRAQRANHIPVHIEFCVALRLYASGAYQTDVGHDFFSASGQTTVCRIFHRFTACLLNLADRFIRFPRTREEREEISNGFQRYTRIPGILGLIDDTIIKLLRPHENEEAFFNYRHRHSVNVQIVSDHNFLIRNVRICPGSNNDRHVWNGSEMQQYLEQLRRNIDILLNEGPYYLTGDNGYSPAPIMLTPLRNAAPNTPGALYTNEICTTRSMAERLNSKLVNKWRILKRERAMRYEPIKAARIIVGSCVLHNFIILNGEAPNLDINNHEVEQHLHLVFDNAAGLREVQYILQRFFMA